MKYIYVDINIQR